jgi:putative phosphonate catabolism associated alcohol dehydrogenase
MANKSASAWVFDAPDLPLHLYKGNKPDAGQGELIVEINYTTLCRSDLNTWCGKRTEKTPTILGHEIVGQIIGFGKKHPRIDSLDQELAIGDTITWAIFAADPSAQMSRAGIPQKSSDLFKYGHERITADSNWHGGLAEYIILRPNTPVARLSNKVPLPVAAIINCAVATVSGSLRMAGNIQGKSVLISGAGMLGHVAVAMFREAGASTIAVSDINTVRLDSCLNFGADTTYDSAAANAIDPAQKFDIVADYTGVPEVMETGLNHLGIGGTAVWIGATYPARNVSISAEKIIRQIHTIKGLHNYNTSDFANAVRFIENNHQRYPFHSLVEKEFPFMDTAAAFQYAMDKNPLRVGIRIGKNQ